MAVTRALSSFSGHFFFYILYLYAFIPGVYVRARGKPQNAGNGEGAQANAADTVTTNPAFMTTAVSSSSAAVSSSVSSSVESTPSPPPNSDSTTNSPGSSNSSVPSSDFPVDSDFPISLPPPSNSTSCGNATFVWTLVDPSFNVQGKQMEVFVTNEDVDQMPFLGNAGTATSMASAANPTPVIDPDGDGDNDAGSFSDSDTDDGDTTLGPQLPQASHVPKTAISLPLSNATVITSGQLTLSALALPQGWYVFAAKSDFTITTDSNSTSNVSSPNDTQTHLIIRSTPFFVADTGNISCIPPALLQISHQNIPTLPLSSAALAGTVVGCLVGVMILVGACLLPRLWRRGVPGHKAWIGRRKLYHIF